MGFMTEVKFPTASEAAAIIFQLTASILTQKYFHPPVQWVQCLFPWGVMPTYHQCPVICFQCMMSIETFDAAS